MLTGTVDTLSRFSRGYSLSRFSSEMADSESEQLADDAGEAETDGAPGSGGSGGAVSHRSAGRGGGGGPIAVVGRHGSHPAPSTSAYRYHGSSHGATPPPGATSDGSASDCESTHGAPAASVAAGASGVGAAAAPTIPFPMPVIEAEPFVMVDGYGWHDPILETNRIRGTEEHARRMEQRAQLLDVHGRTFYQVAFLQRWQTKRGDRVSTADDSGGLEDSGGVRTASRDDSVRADSGFTQYTNAEITSDGVAEAVAEAVRDAVGDADTDAPDSGGSPSTGGGLDWTRTSQ